MQELAKKGQQKTISQGPLSLISESQSHEGAFPRIQINYITCLGHNTLTALSDPLCRESPLVSHGLLVLV